MKSTNGILNIAGVSGAIAIILGAFGAHGLEKVLTAHYLEVFNTGVRYQMFHTLAILAVSMWGNTNAVPKRLVRAVWAWLIGIIIFSGSLYLLAITEIKWLGMITPIGGVSFIVGWILLISWKPIENSISSG